jgi:hypothetical protein
MPNRDGHSRTATCSSPGTLSTGFRRGLLPSILVNRASSYECGVGPSRFGSPTGWLGAEIIRRRRCSTWPNPARRSRSANVTACLGYHFRMDTSGVSASWTRTNPGGCAALPRAAPCHSRISPTDSRIVGASASPRPCCPVSPSRPPTGLSSMPESMGDPSPSFQVPRSVAVLVPGLAAGL